MNSKTILLLLVLFMSASLCAMNSVQNNPWAELPFHEDHSYIREHLLVGQSKRLGALDDSQLILDLEAIEGGNEDVARKAIRAGAVVDMPDFLGDFLLHWAAHGGHAGVVRVLLDHNRSLVDVRNRDQMTPLHFAARYGHVSAAAALLEYGANIEAKDAAGRTALYLATFFEQVSMVQFLVARKANVKAQTSFKHTPLHQAAYDDSTDIMKLLLRNGADINARDNDGQTPLHVAVEVGRVAATRLLLRFFGTVFLKKGADANIKDNCGRKPLDIALHRKSTMRADLNGQDYAGVVRLLADGNESEAEAAFQRERQSRLEDFNDHKFVMELFRESREEDDYDTSYSSSSELSQSRDEDY